MSNFKVGDRVYCPAYSKRIEIVLGTDFCDYPLGVGEYTFTECGREYETCVSPFLLHATPENHALLSQLYPNVTFEKPQPTGSDLTRQLLADGAKEVLCWVSDASDEDAVKGKIILVVNTTKVDGRFVGKSVSWKYAVPVPRNYYAMDDEDS